MAIKKDTLDGGKAQQPQQLFEEEGADRDLEARSAHSSRPGGDVRSEADCPLSAPVSGLRREDRVDVSRGMTVREIQGHLLELYGLEVSPGLISTVTDAVLETVAEWQNRPLEPMYPLVFFDALRVKIRDEGLVRNKAVSRLASRRKEPRTSWAFGSRPRKALNSGCAS